ncbi:alpha/beta fold hydrolase [Puia dinghuensis]|uniref:Homoserine O-acetyltransferase n=1 Tax=Puia dinghuensis TaxID=1792502 RepID=A0A8J2UH90_9BACT|nr:alpha/beta fold hydrolase [Puia dinghuensis]GGB17323.1 homoserine O-acetyltransferase [Puia dinghuensis]
MRKLLLLLPALLLAAAHLSAQLPDSTEVDYQLPNFTFQSGETLPVLRLHYTTFGKPIKDNTGKVINAVYIMHGTTGNSHNFTNSLFAGHLFQKGQLLDATKYYIILPDGIGHGRSSKPSDGLHMKFPQYTYEDMVRADYTVLTQKMGINHLRLIIGTSMGAMHCWLWAETYPDFMDACMANASLPIAIAGRNRMSRYAAIQCVESDPAWKGGEYTTPPVVGLRGAYTSLFWMTSSPYNLQKRSPTREQAEKAYDIAVENFIRSQDANDMIYAFDASRYYNPEPKLSTIKCPFFAVNSADDEVNPPELGVMETAIKKVPKGRYILIPWSERTSGHGTHTNPTVWGDYLKELMNSSGPK